jgi:hypothetical protein
MADDTVTAEFETTMRSLVKTRASLLVEEGLLTPEAKATVHGQSYGFPPAAQQWPMFLYNLYLDARPYLTDGASLIAWGIFFRNVLSAVKEWTSARQEAVDYEAIPPGQAAQDVANHPILTRLAIISLCCSDLAERYEIFDAVSIEAHCRGFPGFSGPDHPGYTDRYLVRAKVGRRSFFWGLDGDGTVSDHHVVASGHITLLPLPDFGSFGQKNWQEPMPPYRIMIKSAEN